MKIVPGLASVGLLCLAVAVNAHSTSPDLVIVNARVYTGVTATPWAEAVSIRGDRILEVGTSESIRKQAGAATRVIDAAGRLVIPGINDAHTHPGAEPDYTP